MHKKDVAQLLDALKSELLKDDKSAPRVKKPRRQQKTPAYLTESEIDRFMRVIKDPRDRAMFAVAYHRGLRASELALIQLCDYHEDTGRLFIRRLKGSNGGEYPLTHSEKVALRVWIRRRGDKPGPLFLSRKHRGIGRIMLHYLMHKYCEMAHIDKSKAHMHALKHSCGTHLSAMDPDIVSIQDHLGHKQIQNTMRYIQVSSKRREQFAERTTFAGWGKVKR